MNAKQDAIHAKIAKYKAALGCPAKTKDVFFKDVLSTTLLAAYSCSKDAAYAMVAEALNDEDALVQLLRIDEDELAEMSHDEKLFAIFSVERNEAFGLCCAKSRRGYTYWVAAAVPGADYLWVSSVDDVITAEGWIEDEMYNNYDAETGKFDYSIFPAR